VNQPRARAGKKRPAPNTRSGAGTWWRSNSVAALVLVAVVAGLAIAVSRSMAPPSREFTVTIPALSPVATRGRALFDANCAQCHGANAAGTTKGPPFVHDIYNPGHHGDGAFRMAARRGVRQHHWRFGNMPPQPQVSDAEIQEIIRYVRELQAANGIKYRPHRM